ncbi:hypothetical protein [Sphingomonas sp. BK580]|uniref:hypothetical protein n=1 Tax=Sphingomonas sp. BK580 TaxID=2586972 RepID=UPI001614CF3A|nr:hypothetical protein [Sphingomonas sp. BK580]MBB3693031.1 hypothetical protein [Sphingomonas sp. BK580]
MTQPADHLDAQAQELRSIATGVLQSGRPFDVAWPNGGRKTLYALTAQNILEDAEAFERDAVKLRALHS